MKRKAKKKVEKKAARTVELTDAEAAELDERERRGGIQSNMRTTEGQHIVRKAELKAGP